MNKTNNKNLTYLSKELRNNMTKEEKHLWYDFLKMLPQNINRQKVLGNYIVDFYCHSAKLVVEIDGSQHFYDEEQEQGILNCTFICLLFSFPAQR